MPRYEVVSQWDDQLMVESYYIKDGVSHVIGRSYHKGEPCMFLREGDAQDVCHHLNCAYYNGQSNAQAEMRKALGM